MSIVIDNQFKCKRRWQQKFCCLLHLSTNLMQFSQSYGYLSCFYLSDLHSIQAISRIYMCFFTKITVLKKMFVGTIQCKYNDFLYQYAWATITEYHKLVGLNNRILFYYKSGSQQSKIKVLSGLVYGRPLFLDLETAVFSLWLSLCSLQRERLSELQCLFQLS